MSHLGNPDVPIRQLKGLPIRDSDKACNKIIGILSIRKKAMSYTIATLLLVLVSIAGLLLVANIYKSLVPQLSPEFDCTKIKINPPISILKACNNQVTNEIEVTISRKIDSPEFTSLSFNLDNQEYNCGYQCGGQCIIQSPGQTKTYFFAEQTSNSVLIEVNNCLLASSQITTC
jgi:hypothetical protein